MAGTDTQDAESAPELVTFQVRAACVYTPIPPATSYGHRAELWDVENYFMEVRVRVVEAGEELFIRLEDTSTGELFAECPLPSDGTCLTRSVEPVVDSSRYYVLRVVDRANPKKHAFIGLGFRDRGESSSFSMALDEYRVYLKRRAEAEELRKAHEEDETSSGTAEQGSNGSTEGTTTDDSTSTSAQKSKFALPAGQTISIKLPLGHSVKSPRALSDTDKASDNGGVKIIVSGSGQEAGGDPRLMPPPPRVAPPRSASGAAAALEEWAVFSAAVPSGAAAKSAEGGAQAQTGMRVSGEGGQQQSEEQGADDWGDFQDTTTTNAG